MKYILASASDRRKELLSRIVDEFEVIVSNFDEESVKFEGKVDEYVKALSEGKANEVINRFPKEKGIIIASDTIVVIDNCILGKPKDEKDAFNMIKKLSGRAHEVYSSITVINTMNGFKETRALATKVYFSYLSDKEILEYINKNESLDKAGAYGIQGFGGVLVEKIEGCYYNVMGLPINMLNKMLNKAVQ